MSERKVVVHDRSTRKDPRSMLSFLPRPQDMMDNVARGNPPFIPYPAGLRNSRANRSTRVVHIHTHRSNTPQQTHPRRHFHSASSPALASSSTLAFLGESAASGAGSSPAFRLPLVAGGAGLAASWAFFLRTRPVRSVAVLAAASTRACVSAADSPRAAPRMPPRELASGPPPRRPLASMGSLRRSTSCAWRV